MKHLIDPMDLSLEELDHILNLAQDIIDHKEKYSELCKGKKLATLFFEPSTRTRLSFEAAMMELGGNVLGFSSASSSSSSKGESVGDTVKVVSCYADIIAMRHFKEGAPMLASMKSDVPIINAGDGGHNHPTQTLADLLTIKREKGRLDNLVIGFCGDLMFGRTVHSLIKAMSRYENISFVLISPDELKIPDYIRTEVIEKNNIPYKEVSSMEDVIGAPGAAGPAGGEGTPGENGKYYVPNKETGCFDIYQDGKLVSRNRRLISYACRLAALISP